MCATVLFRRQTSYGGNAGSREPTADIDRGSADAQQLSRRRELITALTAAAAAAAGGQAERSDRCDARRVS